jgi:hypothetical protein
MTGCSSTSTQGTSAASIVASAPVGAHMGGPAVDISVTATMVADTPSPWVLSSPASAVRSYLDWTSYAYRIAFSGAASATMSAAEFVRVDAYVQLNIEKKQLIDQSLTSITVGKPVVETTHTLVPTKEQWTYTYLSIAVGNEILGGPYTASYDTTYTVFKKDGHWVVDSVAAKALGTVK